MDNQTIENTVGLRVDQKAPWQKRLFLWATSPTLRLFAWLWREVVKPVTPYVFTLVFLGSTGMVSWSFWNQHKAKEQNDGANTFLVQVATAVRDQGGVQLSVNLEAGKPPFNFVCAVPTNPEK